MVNKNADGSMITPAEILEKATRIYPRAVMAWLNGLDHELFPWRIPANLKLTDVHSENIHGVQQLRESAKEIVGYGYSVEWERRNSRKFGENDFFPKAIAIHSRFDLLKLTGKLNEFKRLESRVTKIRQRLPELELWLKRGWQRIVDLDTLEDLLAVAEFLIRNPRPGCFARELPLAVPTKLIQQNRALLTEWLDILLPDESIDCSCDPRNFEQRYGFRYFRAHILTRILDPDLQKELGLFTAELSLPPQEIANIPIGDAKVVMVENQVTLLTLPPIKRGIAFFGMGKGITQLFEIPWLQMAPITYWGDLDVEGFEILAMLRRRYPQTSSILMDLQTVREFEHLGTAGTLRQPVIPSELNANEAAAFLRCRENNLRIEQEHIQQAVVNAALDEPWSSRSADSSPRSSNRLDHSSIPFY